MRVLFLIALFISSFSVFAEEESARQQYIERWKDVAIQQMIEHGIPASITLAQGILESGNGQSMLTREANNHFGIKCHGWNGPGVYKDDDKKNECFRKYRNAEESFEDHSQFLKKKRYQFLYDYKVTDYKAWARGLKKAGYATDPAYARRLIDIIEQNELHKYDRQDALAQHKPKKERASSTPRFSKQKDRTERDEVIDLTVGREVMLHENKIKFIRGRAGDTPESLAQRLDLADWQIRRYNDVTKGHRFSDGDIIYIQPKRKQSRSAYHLSIQGETLRLISQRYGVKLDRLEKYNGLQSDEPLSAGTKVHLRKP